MKNNKSVDLYKGFLGQKMMRLRGWRGDDVRMMCVYGRGGDQISGCLDDVISGWPLRK